MCITGLKKITGVWISPRTDFNAFELDELHWFTNRKYPVEIRENSYIITLTSRKPRQIVGFDVNYDIEAARIQQIVNKAPPAARYYTDGFHGYMDVDFPGKHIRNSYDKSDTFLTESINSDLRHYISGLFRKSKTFFRSQETKYAVMSLFVNAYNKFGDAKEKHLIPVKRKCANPSKHLHKFRDVPFSIIDFL